MAEFSNCFFSLSLSEGTSSCWTAHTQKSLFISVVFSTLKCTFLCLAMRWILWLETFMYGRACLCVWSTTQVITNLVKMVKARDIRRPFCPAGHWLSEEVNIRADKVLWLSSQLFRFCICSLLLLCQISALLWHEMSVNKKPDNLELYSQSFQLWVGRSGQSQWVFTELWLFLVSSP